MTSHDVVVWFRHLLGHRRVGHAGTLDPLGAGVLPVCVGKATRLAEYLMAGRKRYRVLLALGRSTSTDDAAGEVICEADAGGVGREDLEAVLAGFRGEVVQRPPAASAVRVGGERLYRRFRRGEAVEAPPRRVVIDRLELLAWWPGRRAYALLDVTCGGGTYVRALCRDVGAALGCGGHAAFLVRTAVGMLDVASAVTLEEVAAVGPSGVAALALTPAQALAHLPAVVLDAAAVAAVRHGRQPVAAPAETAVANGSTVRLLDADGCLVAVARWVGGRLRLEKVLA
ncbi:MAG: tRNA pseudouridine(55) synthase TruB [Clostridia bacterium]|nr:tRNA pseudouridine(55) synthase TruB [Clostridia bacterium]